MHGDVFVEMLIILGGCLGLFLVVWAGYHGMNYPEGIPIGLVSAFVIGELWCGGAGFIVLFR